MDYFDILLAKKISGGGGGDIEVETLNATENGTYNAGIGKAYNPVVVNLPLGEKVITANGEYNASADDLKGYSKVTVNVEGYQIKSIANVPTDIASFTDGTDLPMPKLEVGIEAVQSGSGDPSPSNVRPISGWSGAEIVNMGTLQLMEATQSSISSNGITLDYEGFGKYRVSGQMTNDQQTEINCNITSFTVYDGTDSAIRFNNNYARSGLSIYMFMDNTLVEQWSLNVTNRDSSYSQMRGKKINNFKLVIPRTMYGSDIDFTFQIMIYGTNSNYTYPFTWSEAGTVYAGTLDVTNGTLKARPYYASYNGEALVGPWISSLDKYVEGTTPTTGAQVVDLGGTETTYQLTPTQVSSILGANNIWADSGQIISGQYFAEL